MQVFLLAIALAMDSFALSLALGVIYSKNDYKSFAIKSALILGLCQSIFFFGGSLLGNIIELYLLNLLKGISFLLLLFVALKMAYEFFKNDDVIHEIELKKIIYIGCLTSIDAFVTGIATAVYEYNNFSVSFVILLTTFVLCCFGFFISKRLSRINWIEKYALLLSAFILFILAIEVLITK